MKDYQSYISEHTLEYFLIPRILKVFKQQYPVVVPIFPWIGREGSSFSKSLHKTESFKMFGLYPRRPKFNKIDMSEINFKINVGLIESLKIASIYHVPLIAGSSLINNLWDLGNDTDCVWIKLDPDSKDTYHIEYTRDGYGKYIINDSKNLFSSDIELLQFVSQNCKTINFESAINCIKMVNRQNSFGFFAGGYKPIYFLLKD